MAARLRKHTARLGAFHAWNKCLNHLLDLANAHVESVILDAFYAGVAGCADPDVRKALKVRQAAPAFHFASCPMKHGPVEL